MTLAGRLGNLSGIGRSDGRGPMLADVDITGKSVLTLDLEGKVLFAKLGAVPLQSLGGLE